jgi:hypothetical protein
MIIEMRNSVERFNSRMERENGKHHWTGKTRVIKTIQ